MCWISGKKKESEGTEEKNVEGEGGGISHHGQGIVLDVLVFTLQCTVIFTTTPQRKGDVLHLRFEFSPLCFKLLGRSEH